MTALEIVIDGRKETANLYAQLAILAAGAKQDRKGDAGRGRRRSTSTPKDQRKQLKRQIDLQKSQLGGPAAGPATERLSRNAAATIAAPRPCSSTGRAADS